MYIGLFRRGHGTLCRASDLCPDHFYFHNHQIIFDALLQLHHENSEIDEILIAEKLSSANNLDKIGGKEALFELSARIDTTAHAPYWLDIVKQRLF